MEFHTALDAPCYYGNWYQQRVSLSARPDAARYYGNWYQIYLRQKKPLRRGAGWLVLGFDVAKVG